MTWLDRPLALRRVAARRHSALALAAALALAGPLAHRSFAQPAAPAAGGAAAVAAAGAPAGVGLDALSDDVVMNELAARGQDSLLNHMFEVKKLPKEQRDAFVGLQAFRELSDRSKPLPERRRQQLVGQAVAG